MMFSEGAPVEAIAQRMAEGSFDKSFLISEIERFTGVKVDISKNPGRILSIIPQHGYWASELTLTDQVFRAAGYEVDYHRRSCRWFGAAWPPDIRSRTTTRINTTDVPADGAYGPNYGSAPNHPGADDQAVYGAGGRLHLSEREPLHGGCGRPLHHRTYDSRRLPKVELNAQITMRGVPRAGQNRLRPNRRRPDRSLRVPGTAICSSRVSLRPSICVSFSPMMPVETRIGVKPPSSTRQRMA